MPVISVTRSQAGSLPRACEASPGVLTLARRDVKTCGSDKETARLGVPLPMGICRSVILESRPSRRPASMRRGCPVRRIPDGLKVLPEGTAHDRGALPYG